MKWQVGDIVRLKLSYTDSTPCYFRILRIKSPHTAIVVTLGVGSMRCYNVGIADSFDAAGLDMPTYSYPDAKWLIDVYKMPGDVLLDLIEQGKIEGFSCEALA